MKITQSATTSTPSKGNILVVDDTPANLKVLTQMLSEQQYKVRIAPGGKFALDSINIEAPDLILLDILMPDIDGYQVCEKIKANEKTRHIPIIFISALNEVIDKVKSFEIGGVDYITKPFEPVEVLARIKNQLNLQYLKLELQSQNQKLQEEIDLRKKIELEIQKLNEELNQRNQELEILNQDLEAFNYRVAHDLRNALTSIITKCYMLQKKYEDQLESSYQTYITSIEESAVKMSETMNGLLSLSQIRHSQVIPAIVNLSEIVEDIANHLQIEETSRKVEFIIHPDIEALGDKNLLKIALENLINNAWKYSAKTELARIEFGVLSILKEDWEKTDLIPEILIKAKNNHQINSSVNNMIYFVRDNGVGFDIEKADKIFTPFERLHGKNEFMGTGIGLSTVQRIIQRHNGLICCDSQVNHGANFYFTLNVKLFA
jgi:two-component system, sensor histidine kinase and response regulator